MRVVSTQIMTDNREIEIDNRHRQENVNRGAY